MDEPLTFLATIPDLRSAINLPGNEEDAPRFKLDIDPNDTPAALRLCLMRNKVLKVTIEVADVGRSDG